jgi:hypothetical protein
MCQRTLERTERRGVDFVPGFVVVDDDSDAVEARGDRSARHGDLSAGTRIHDTGDRARRQWH